MYDTTTGTALGRKAREVLRAIEANPDALDMGTWWEGPGTTFVPDETPCGTTMCVAGWRAHLSGWTLVEEGRAVKGDSVPLRIEHVAVEEFEPANEEERLALLELFYTGPSRALAVLRYVAENGTFPPGGCFDDALAPYWRD